MKNININQIERIKQGDLKAFESMFREYYSILCEYATKILRDSDKAEETVQDLFYNIWKKKEKLNINVSIKSYLFRSVHNNCLLIIQHKGVEKKYEDYIKHINPSFTPDPSEQLRYKELSETINKIMNQLPIKCKEVFRLSRHEGLKYKEIADKLSISVKTVEVHMGKALRYFRENLREYVSVIIIFATAFNNFI